MRVCHLDRIHSAGYCHTDIRLPNILRFGDNFELIDYGDAVKHGEEVDTYKFSTRRKQLVTVKSRKVIWQRSHDIEMLARTVLNVEIQCEDVSQTKRSSDESNSIAFKKQKHKNKN